MTTKNLLVELFVEELPPKALKKLGDAFANQLFEQLKAQGLAGADSVVTPFASPRRLAAHVSQVWLKAEDKAVQLKLMPASVGLTPDGQATPALLKKLAALGADLSDPAALEAAIRPETRMLLVETPTNPLLRLVDLEALAADVDHRGLRLDLLQRHAHHQRRALLAGGQQGRRRVG